MQSLTNSLLSGKMNGAPEIVVGLGVSICGYSDRSPGTVVNVSKNGKKISVQYDDWTITKGSAHDGSANYEYTQNVQNSTLEFTLRPNGRWIEVGGTDKAGRSLAIGRREKYYDPSF
jgi:hypothetical protein